MQPTPQPQQNYSLLFNSSFPALRDRCASLVMFRHFDKDTPLIRHGDEAQNLWLVIKGWVKLIRQTPEGKETVVGLCTSGDVFGEAALFTNATYPYHAEVIADDTSIALLSAASLRQLVQQDASFANHIMSMLVERASETQLKLDQLNTMTAAQRLGCFLLRLCRNEIGLTEKTLRIPVEKNILAAHLGMKPETLSRSQQQLKEIDIAVNGAEVKIADISKLAEFVCNSCSESGNCTVEEAASD